MCSPQVGNLQAGVPRVVQLPLFGGSSDYFCRIKMTGNNVLDVYEMNCLKFNALLQATSLDHCFEFPMLWQLVGV